MSRLEIAYVAPLAVGRLFALRREQRRDKRISWRTFGVGLAIASFADRDSGEAWPSRATLSAITGITPRNVSLAIRELERAGFLETQDRDGQSNIYRLTLVDSDTLVCPDTLVDSDTLSIPTGTLVDSDTKPLSIPTPITTSNQPISTSMHTTALFASPHDDHTEKKTRFRKPKVTLSDSGFVIPDAIRQTWATAFPGVDIDREAARAFAWCQSNSRRAPKANHSRFLHAWLNRADPVAQSAPAQDDGTLGYLAYKLEHVEAKHGEDVARRYDAEARRLKSTDKADEWLKREIECRTA